MSITSLRAPHKRRAGVAVDSGVSSRTSVRTQTGTAYRGSSTTRQTVGGGTNGRERSSGQAGQGSIGESPSPQGQSGAAQGSSRSGGQTTGRSGTPGSSGGQQMPANR